MIVIKESRFLKDKMSGEHNKKTMPCFKCGTEHIFFNASPVMCWKCNQIFPNARLLSGSGDCRIIYHKYTENG